jgi:hypothetical protein
VKKWSWRLYLIGVHAALILAVSAFAWVGYFDRGLPVSIDWLDGFGSMPSGQPTLQSSGTLVDQDFAYIRVNGDAIASLLFEDRQLVMMDFAWPGDDIQWTMTEANSLLMQPYFVDVDNYAGLPTITGGDHDGDRMIDTERHSLPDRSEHYRRVREHRYTRGVGPHRTTELIYNRLGEITARTENDATKPLVTIEYLENGAVTRTETVPFHEFDIDTISDQLWDTD